MTATTLAIAKPEIWETIPGAPILNIIEAFTQCGVDVAPTLARFDIRTPLKNDTAVDSHQAALWLEHVLEAYPQRGLGLLFSKLPTLLDSGMVGYTILSSDTLGEALIERIRFSPLLRPYFGMHLQALDDDVVELVLLEREPPGIGPRARAFGIEHDLASWAGTARRMLGPGRHFELVQCAYPDPQLPERYHEVFGCPVRFDQPRSLVRFRREILERPMPHAHEEAHEICQAQCEQLLAQLRAGSDTTTALRRLMLRRPRKLPDLPAAATALQTSPRTLRRKLQAEGSSFTQVLNEVRMLLARDYLRTTAVAVADIASLLGFADESSLARAFRRVYHTTPRVFRVSRGSA
ncbi:MAG TPA: AraC family transcriptional regulator [Burkholderiaceae bacterium]|nr:AraC family transcriptional regulator [Burkholderiaceae bacterium]